MQGTHFFLVSLWSHISWFGDLVLRYACFRPFITSFYDFSLVSCYSYITCFSDGLVLVYFNGTRILLVLVSSSKLRRVYTYGYLENELRVYHSFGRFSNSNIFPLPSLLLVVMCLRLSSFCSPRQKKKKLYRPSY